MTTITVNFPALTTVPTPSAITISPNPDGTNDILVSWTFTQNVNSPVSGFLLYYGASPLTVASPSVVLSVSAISYLAQGVSQAWTGKVGIASYQTTPYGQIISAIQSINSWNITGTTPNITGTINGTSAANLTDAISTANAVNTTLNNFLSDGVLSVSELQGIRSVWDNSIAEKASINTQATTYSLTSQNTSYNNALIALGTFLNGGVAWTAGIPSFITTTYIGTVTNTGLSIGSTTGADFRAVVSTFETARTAIFQGISDKAATTADYEKLTGTVPAGILNSNVTTSSIGAATTGALATTTATANGAIQTTLANAPAEILNSNVTPALIGAATTGALATTTATANGAIQTTLANAPAGILNSNVTTSSIGAATTAALATTNGNVTAANNAANAAKVTADQAQVTANNVNNGLAAMLADNNLSITELNQIRGTWDIIISEKASILAQASTYSVSVTLYNSTLVALGTFLNGSAWSSGVPQYLTTSFISGVTTAGLQINATTGVDFRAVVNSFETARTAVFQGISDAAAAKGVAAQTTANGAIQTTLANAPAGILNSNITTTTLGAATTAALATTTATANGAIQTNLTNAPAGILNSNITTTTLGAATTGALATTTATANGAIQTTLANAPAEILNSNVTPALIGAATTGALATTTATANGAIQTTLANAPAGILNSNVTPALIGAATTGALATTTATANGAIQTTLANAPAGILNSNVTTSSIGAATTGALATTNANVTTAQGTATTANNTANTANTTAAAANATANAATSSLATKLTNGATNVLAASTALQTSGYAGGSGLIITDNGITAKKGGVSTFAVASDGTATFSGMITGSNGQFTNPVAVQGLSAYSISVVGMGGNVGVFGQGTVIGVTGQASAPSAWGVSAQNGIGGFALNVQGKMSIDNSTQVANLNATYVGGYSIDKLCTLVVTNSGTCTIAGAGFNLSVAGSLAGSYRTTGSGNYVYITDVSDERLKKEIMPESLGLDFISRLRPVTYRMKADDTLLHHGFIAQDMQEHFPTSNIDSLLTEAEDGYYGVGYTSLISILTKSIQELSKELNDLKQQLGK